MDYVDLSRLFSKWYSDRANNEDLALFGKHFSGESGWSELLKFQRVVVLAEAGSGKSRELEEQAKRLTSAGEFAFHATVQRVAEEGLSKALRAAGAAKLQEWRNSDQVAWFFIDSVDEAKLDHIRFGDALSELADGIGDARPRARVVISGRYSDWEFRADLMKLLEALPLSTPKEGADLDGGSMLIQILRKDGSFKKSEPDEKPLVVLMAPLDKDRIRLFAEKRGVSDLDAFMAAVEDGDLWSLAKRPLDLTWLVDYWRKNHRFGKFADMLETSIRQRLTETTTERRRKDDLDVDRAFTALARIGATMVFARENRVEIPDSEIDLSSSSKLKVAEILSDWPSDDHPKILSRPVFDPAALGQLQLHNDNDGVVRGFLAAKWLLRRIKSNAPRRRVRELLFAEANGNRIVLPSMRETAAWLAIWDEDTAREIIAREPALLLTSGDPTSLSLATRQAVLTRAVEQLVAGDRQYTLLDRETLKRFSTPDMCPTIQSEWGKHKTSSAVRRLLLWMIQLGRLTDCASIAAEATSGAYTDRTTLLFGVNALGTVGNGADKDAFAKKIKTKPTDFDDAVVWEALEALFPQHLTVSDFISILGALEGKSGTSNPAWKAPTLIHRLESKAELEEAVSGLLTLLGDRPFDDEDDDSAPSSKKANKNLIPILKAAASRLLSLVPARQANQRVIDAAIKIASGEYGQRRFEDDTFYPALIGSPERRREGLWRAVEKLRDHPVLAKHGLGNVSQLTYLGWAAGLKPEDIPWLLEDAKDGATVEKRRLALNGLLTLWRDAGNPAELLEKIRAVSHDDTDATAIVDGWIAPRVMTPDEIELHKKIEASDKAHKSEQAKVDRSWIDLIDRLKADPKQLRKPPEGLKPGNADSRLFYVWRLIYAATSNSSGYAIDDFGPVATVLGPELTAEMREALFRFWREHQATLTSTRKRKKRNQTSMLDSMGITAITMEAKSDPAWASKINSDEATKAAELATQELNGFPAWLRDVASLWPDEVRAVLIKEADDHWRVEPEKHGFIDRLAYGEAELAALVAPHLLDRIERRSNLKEGALSKSLEVIAKALPLLGSQSKFGKLALRRFKTATSPYVASLYLGIAFRIDADAAIEALDKKLQSLTFKEQKKLAEHALPRVFGDRMGRTGIHPRILPLPILERLVGIAHRTIRPENDNVHEDAYTPDDRDSAESARSSLFNELMQRPGRATIEALHRLSQLDGFPITAVRLQELILERASADAEHAPWGASEAKSMEGQFDSAPQTPRDLQRCAMSRISDIDHDLHHHEFAQGQTVKSLPNEREVQKWVANELHNRQGRAFTVTRESHTVDEKEPDIRLQSNVTDASLPVEIKVAHSWSLKQLEDALKVQLVGRYSRQKDKRHGVLLLVHQGQRPRGWTRDGKKLSFPEVVDHLRKLADDMAKAGDDAPQAVICVIDVSDIVIPEEDQPPMKSRAKKAQPKGRAKPKSKPGGGKTASNTPAS